MTQQAVVAVFKADATAFDGTIRGMNAGLARWERGTMGAFGRVEKGMDSLLGYASKLRNLSYAFGAGLGAAQAAQFVDASTRIRNQLRGIGQDGDANFQKVYLASTRALSPMDTFAAAVVRMQKVLGDRQGFDVTIRQMETLSKLMAIGGKSTVERSNTILQFTQALQAGVLQGDEMRSLRENAPVEFMRAIAAAAGGTLQDLKAFGAEGKITTDVMIKALDSLATTADQKMGQVKLTFTDAVDVLRNGALVAADAFNSGSGLSASITSALQIVGSALGNSRAAMETFGKAVEIAAIAMGAAFAGRKTAAIVGGIEAIITAQREGARQALLAARADQAAAAQQVAAAIEVRDKKLAAYAAVQAKGTASAASLAKAQSALIAAETRLGMANEALIVSNDAVAASEARVAMGARAMAAAASIVKGAWAFIGGWPGLLLIVGTALWTFQQNQAAAFQNAVDQIDQNQQALADLGTSYRDTAQAIADDLRKLEQAHADVAAAAVNGQADVESAGLKDIAQIDARIAKNRELLQTYTALMAARLQQSQDDLSKLKTTEKRDVVPKLAAQGDQSFRGGRQANDADVASYLNMVNQKIAAGQRLSDSESEFLQHHLAIIEAQQKVDDQANALSQALATTQEGTQALVARSAADIAASIDQITASAAAAGQTDPAAFLRQMSEELRQVQADFQNGQMDVETYTFLLQSMQTEAQTIEEQLHGVAGVSFGGLFGQFDAMLGWLHNLTTASYGLAAAMPGAADPPATSDAIKRAYQQYGATRQLAATWYVEPDKPPSPGGGGSRTDQDQQNGATRQLAATWYVEPDKPPSPGGGGSRTDQDQQKALDFIREMMTAEEQRAAKMAEMLDLRTKLIATYGEESPLVAQLDQAIQRYQDDAEAANQAQAQFFSDLSDQIANAITDWTNFGDVVRHILASMVQSYGVDFFTALLTPGAQTGGSVGTTLGNILTGQNHSGGDFGNQNARSVSPLAFMGAPRFHNGLMPDEFTAILQKGETVLPKGYKASGGAISINMPIDLRGADPSMKSFIEGQIAQLKKELPGRVVQAVKSAQKSRSL